MPPPDDGKGDKAGTEQGHRGPLGHVRRWRQLGLIDQRVGDELIIVARCTAEYMTVNHETVQLDAFVRYQESPVERGTIGGALDINSPNR